MGADGDAAAAKRAKLAARFGDDGGDGGFGFGTTATVGFGTTTVVNGGKDDGFLKSSASASASASAGTTATVPTSGDANGKRKTPTTSYVCEAGDALRFYPWSGGGAVEAKEEEAFEPEFTHQVFREDETIFGYAGLKLDVHVCASSLKAMEPPEQPPKPSRRQAGKQRG